MIDEELFFEIIDIEQYVRIEPIKYAYTNAELDWDSNWIVCKIKVKGGCFSGIYYAQFLTVDFESFKKDFEKLYNNLDGVAWFYGLENQLEIKIKGDGIGHFEVNVVAKNESSIGAELSFDLSFDQTMIKAMVNQLQKITEAFPVIGTLN